MPDGQITDAKELLEQIHALGDTLRERRRHERKKGLWAATVEVRGQRFEGVIVDLSSGGARIRFDAAVAKGDELTLVLKELDALGAKVAWQREGEAGLQFLLAPEELAARVQRMMGPEAAPLTDRVAPAPAAAKRPSAPRRPAPRLGRGGTAAVAACSAVALIGGSVVVASSFGREAPPPVLAIAGGAADQHSCAHLMGRVTGATNEIDFSLHLAEAAQAKCIDLRHLGDPGSDLGGHMVQATKVPLR